MITFGLMFFAASEDAVGSDKYRLVIDSARFGDQSGFSSIWVPERHFTSFGGLYPNPAVLHAALAMCTSTIRLQAGSVVASLHHPLRIAEEWSVVDNLSQGRVGLSFASGWNPDDFVLAPAQYAGRTEVLYETMQTVRRLWRGDSIEAPNGLGHVTPVRIYPRPVQPELPVWATVAGNPANFIRAGASGANLLTHLLDQDEATLAERIGLYRRAREEAGFDPATGQVSLMIHTLVGTDATAVRDAAREPYCRYIKANMGLFKGLGQSRGRETDLSTLSPADLDEFVGFLYDRFAAARGLIGAPESCLPLVQRLDAIGVTELACLLDFGPSPETIAAHLPHLAALKALAEGGATADQLRRPVIVPTPTATRVEVEQTRQRCQLDEAWGDVARGLQVWRGTGEALASVTLPPVAAPLHLGPQVLDLCCRLLAAAEADTRTIDPTAVPAAAAIGAVRLEAAPAGPVWIHATRTGPGTGTVVVMRADDPDASRLLTLDELRLATHEPPRGSTPVVRDDLAYVRTWVPMTASETSGELRGRWAILDDATGVGPALRALLAEAGGDPSGAITEEGLRGVIDLRALTGVVGTDADTAALAADLDRALAPTLDTAQRAHRGCPAWLVTRGAMADVTAGGADGDTSDTSLPNPVHAAVWGLGRTLAVERPGALGALVDLAPETSARDAARQLAAVITGGGAEDMVAVRHGALYVPRLTRADIMARHDGQAFTADETALITGGTGGLGLQLAAALAAQGVRHLVLVSRNGLADAERLRPLATSGVTVVVLKADLSDEAAFTAHLHHALVGLPPLRGVYHLAGVLDEGRLESQTPERLRGVCRAKALGAWTLHRATQEAPLRHFVVFSSVSSLLPAPGQAGYAAANAVADAVVARRRREGRPALTVNWGPWSGEGHAATPYGRQAHAQLAAMGISSLSSRTALDTLMALMRSDRTQVAVADVRWPQLFRVDPAAARLPFLSSLREPHREPPLDLAVVPDGAPLIEAIRSLPAQDRRPALLAELSTLLSGALRLPAGQVIEPRQPLFDIGLDSILALELKDRLERLLGVRLSATVFFVHPTLDALAAFILADLVGAAPPPTAAPASDDALSEDELTRLLLRELDGDHGA